MTIEDLKESIEKKTISDDGLVFVYDGNRFLVDQYISEISLIRGRVITYCEQLNQTGFLQDMDDGNLTVVILEEFNSAPPKNTVIITKKSSYNDAVFFPTVEKWQIRDYVYSVCDGSDTKVLDALIEACSDLYCLDNEISKVKIFDKKIRNTLSKQFYEDKAFRTASNLTMFDFARGVQDRDKDSVTTAYSRIENEPMALVGILYKQFRNMVNVYLQSNPTEQNTSLKQNQIWAIKNVCKKYTKQEVFDRFRFLSSIDKMVKSGYISTDILLDYVLIKMFTL